MMSDRYSGVSGVFISFAYGLILRWNRLIGLNLAGPAGTHHVFPSSRPV